MWAQQAESNVMESGRRYQIRGFRPESQRVLGLIRERTQGWTQRRPEQARFISAKQSESQAEVSPSRREVGGSQGSAAGGPKTSVFWGGLWSLGWSVLESWGLSHQLLPHVGQGVLGLGWSHRGCRFPWAVWLWASQNLLCVTSCSVNVPIPGCDSISVSKPWFSAIRLPNSLATPASFPSRSVDP
jgi:hypothetical protein